MTNCAVCAVSFSALGPPSRKSGSSLEEEGSRGILGATQALSSTNAQLPLATRQGWLEAEDTAAALGARQPPSTYAGRTVPHASFRGPSTGGRPGSSVHLPGRAALSE